MRRVIKDKRNNLTQYLRAINKGWCYYNCAYCGKKIKGSDNTPEIYCPKCNKISRVKPVIQNI